MVPHVYAQLIFDSGKKDLVGEELTFQLVLEPLDVHRQNSTEQNCDTNLISYTNINSKCITDLFVKLLAIKLAGKKCGRKCSGSSAQQKEKNKHDL